MLKKFTDLKKTAERLADNPKTPYTLRNYYLNIIRAIEYATLEEILNKNNIKHSGMCLDVRNLKELTEARKQLRNAFGTWSDKVSNIFHFIDTTMIARYTSEDNDVYIDLRFDVSDVPEGLIADTCRIEKQSETYTNTSESYSVVCSED